MARLRARPRRRGRRNAGGMASGVKRCARHHGAAGFACQRTGNIAMLRFDSEERGHIVSDARVVIAPSDGVVEVSWSGDGAPAPVSTNPRNRGQRVV